MAQVDIVSLKDNADPARRLRLAIRDDSGRHVGDLQCIDRSMLDEPGLIDDLTTWRNQSMPFFLSQFNATQNARGSGSKPSPCPPPTESYSSFAIPAETGSAISASATSGPVRPNSTTSSAAGRAICET